MTDMPEVSWPEVGLEEIAIGLLEARFWTACGFGNNPPATHRRTRTTFLAPPSR